MPSTALSLRAVRRDLRGCLESTWLPADDVEDLVLATSEAVSNVLEHAQHPTEPFFDVVLSVVPDQVTITVRDSGQWRDEPSGTHRGRGLAMMDTLAETTILTEARGTTVTLRHRAGRRAAVASG
ncbi:ATP-binding protein [Geodermatophilus sabuli]|uniref:ATP-binding protein n=1 Tax=Geodermatophilus sabuli TaxID=1564158 RepID=UPI001558B7EF|nr:ATP-binding protein [Geodermatophilus sabuli]MBB3083904.1 anti-sigma regulatory factor (Ser/Thr protein kinase) [Geodermatophilus sabuli]